MCKTLMCTKIVQMKLFESDSFCVSLIWEHNTGDTMQLPFSVSDPSPC